MAFNPQGNRLGPAQPMVEINTTPLVDVMLVLLVIFIITVPIFHQAVPVDLPKVDATRLEDKPRVLRVALDGAGQLRLDGQPVSLEQLASAAGQAVAGDRLPPELHLSADRATRYERVVELMATAQRAGLTHIAFVTEGRRDSL
jgi:biopolymer transport protein ExbD